MFGLGYLPRLRSSRFEKTHRVDAFDLRLHFALNCGAASCPPIAAYSTDRLDDELTLASESYLGREVVYDLDRGVVRVPQLFLWYHGDFGGRRGTLDLLRTYGNLSDEDSPKIRSRSYDWSLDLDNVLDRAGARGDFEERPDAGAQSESEPSSSTSSAPSPESST